MGRILEPLEAKALLKCEKAIKAAVQGAAKEIKKDITEKIFNQAVADYYEDYTPNRYRRSKSLYNAFRAYARTNGKRIDVSGDWDFNRLPQHTSNSPYHKSGTDWIDFYSRSDDDDNGMPEKGWIFENFMEGIHPRFFFDKKLGVMIDDSDRFTPSWKRIKKYKDEYFASDAMRDILLRNLKKQYKKM